MRAIVAIILAVASLSFAALAQTTEPSAAGLWLANDENGNPDAWFLIREHDGVYEGLIVRMYMKPGQRPDIVCDRCTDDRQNKPWLGLDIIRGMKRDGLNYTDGTILDPRNGDIYRAKMNVEPDGKTLVVRGYLGISLFGQNRYWTRLPDSTFSEIDPRFNPNPIAAHKPKALPKPANSATR